MESPWPIVIWCVCVAGLPCFLHDRYMLRSDLSMADNAAITARDVFSPNLEWDAESEAAWCPMIGHTYLRNVHCVCTVLPKIKIGV